MLKKAAVVVVSCFLLAAVAVHDSRACSCAPPLAASDELQRSGAVFAGGVIEVVPEVLPGGVSGFRVTFAVTAVWKGPVQGKAVVVTPASAAVCGYAFSPNVQYLVYAQDILGSLSTHQCTRTKPLIDAREDLDELGAPLFTLPTDQSTWSRIKALYTP